MKQAAHHDPDQFVYYQFFIHEQMKRGHYNIVDQLSQICQTVMWGDKNNDIFFDYFCDQNTLQLYLQLVTKSESRDVIIQVIKSLTMLLQNIQKPTSLNYILSHPAINRIITADYNFIDDEIIAYYINLLKCVSIRVDATNIQLFFNLKFSTFPLMMRAISFYNHKENLIRTSVRNIVLGVAQVKQNSLRRYLRNFPFVLFYIQFSCYMRDTLFYIDNLISEGRAESQKIIKLLIDDQLDILYFLEDFMKTNQDALTVIINSVFAYGFIPSIVMSLLPTNTFTYTNNNRQQLNIKFILYLLTQIYKTFTFPEFLDLLTLILLGRDSKIVEFIVNQNHHSQLKTYSKQISMSSIWEGQHKFTQVYSQYIFKNGCIEDNVEQDMVQSIQSSQCNDLDNDQQVKSQLTLKFFKDLLVDDGNSSDLFTELQNITDILGLDMVPNNEVDDLECNKCPLNLMRFYIEGNVLRIGELLPLESQQDKSFFHSLMNNLRSQDDTVVYMVLLFLKTLRHSKCISHNILQHIGLITPDKNLGMYEQCLPTREYLQDHLLNILELGAPPYRLGTYILASQLLMDLSRISLDVHQLTENRRLFLMRILAQQLQKVDQYLNNQVEAQYVIEFFTNEYKGINKNTISIWPHTHMGILMELSAPGVCQIDPKHNESVYFIDPIQPTDKVRRDLIILMILKYVGSTLIGYTPEQQEILSNQNLLRVPDPTIWQVGQTHDLSLPQFARWRNKCKMKQNNMEQEGCLIIEDEFNIIVAQDLGNKQAKVLLSLNIKHTDEVIEKMNLKILHITYYHKNQTIIFDLEFSNKLICQDVKKDIDHKKAQLKKSEQSTIQKFLQTLEQVTK